jgi:hypothetical protein
LKQHFTTEEEINTRKKVMKKVFQTHDKRTVRRRLARLKGQAPTLGILPWYHLKNPGLKAHAPAGCHDGGKLAS